MPPHTGKPHLDVSEGLPPGRLSHVRGVWGIRILESEEVELYLYDKDSSTYMLETTLPLRNIKSLVRVLHQVP